MVIKKNQNPTIKLRFFAKPFVQGNSLVVVIPKDYVNAEYVKVGENYSFEVEVNAE